MLSRVFKAFRYPDFRLLWIGACVSSIGTWMQILAQSWLVYKLSNSSVYLGLDAFFGQIPIFLLSLFGGVFADRTNRRTMLLISQVMQLSCAFTLSTLVLLHVVQVWHIWCLSFVVGVAQSFGGPAYAALVPSLVPKEDLQNAIALNSIQFNLARVVGPALGGLALVKLGAAWCFALNGVSYIAVIASLVAIKSAFVPGKSPGSVLESMREGINFLKRREGMVPLVVLAFLVTLFSYPTITFLPVLARDVFHGSEQTFTLFLCLSGFGSVTGALMVAGVGSSFGSARDGLLTLLLLGAVCCGIGSSGNLVVTSVLIFLAGALLLVVFAVNSSLVQWQTTDAMRGRVMSVYNVAFRGGMPVGSLIAGFVIKETSVPMILIANGLLVAFFATYFLLFQKGLQTIEAPRRATTLQ